MLIGRPRVGLVKPTVVLAAGVVATLVAACGSPSATPASPGSQRSIVTSTTKIAGAGVLGNQRRPDESCAAEPTPLDADAQERQVRNAAGPAGAPKIPATTDLRGDPQRIVVLAGDQLDALCALGLQSRIVAAALPDGSSSQPSYLGTVVHDVPAVGTRSAPDMAAIRAAAPDLILGSQALTPDGFAALSAIAPTVFTGPPGAGWEDNLRTVGAATGRAEAADGLLEDFSDVAKQTGIGNDAAHYQASVVQLTDKTIRIWGAKNFPASVLAAVGLDRPAAQRFTDKPYTEVSTTGLEDASDTPDFSAADGDIVYVSFASAAAKDRAPVVLDSDAWHKLSAAKDNRVFVVNNEVWQTSEGVVAARGILADLRWVNAPIN